MISKNKKNIILIVLLIIYIPLFFLIISKSLIKYTSLINCMYIILLAMISKTMFGFKKEKIDNFKFKTIIMIFITLLMYFTIYYLLGLIVGYQVNGYSLKVTSVIKNSIIPLLSVISLEIFRYIVVSSNKESKSNIIIYFILITLFDIILNYYGIEYSLIKFFIYLTVNILPIIFKNILLTYLTKNIGYKACLIYVIPLCIFKYFVPSFPNLGNYLTCVLGITLPTLVYIYSSRFISNRLKEQSTLTRILKLLKTIIIEIPFIIFIILIVGLISGVLSYQLIGIDTSNISKKIDKGDLVLIYKNLNYNDYSKGDIIVYKNNKKIIIDIISKIEENDYGNKKIYVTKEINEGKENKYYYVDKESIIGIYNNFKIKKIAYPTIWFKELIGGNINE